MAYSITTSYSHRLYILGVMFLFTSMSNAQEQAKVDAAKHPPRPNILFIAVDDLRPELGCYGTDEIRTPNIDALSASGVTLTRAYCQQAVCNPSRASVMTGLRPDSTKVWDLITNFRETVPNVVTLPQQLMKHGYYAAAYGKIYHNPIPDPQSWHEPNH